MVLFFQLAAPIVKQIDCIFIFIYLLWVHNDLLDIFELGEGYLLTKFSKNRSMFDRELLSSQTTHSQKPILYGTALSSGFQKVQNHFCWWPVSRVIGKLIIRRNLSTHPSPPLLLIFKARKLKG